MKKILFLLLMICAIAPAQANWLSGLTGWCSDNKQIVAGAGIIAGGLFANQILKACTTKKGSHCWEVRAAYKDKNKHAKKGYTCYPAREIAHKNGNETYGIFINSGWLNPFHHYAESTYANYQSNQVDASKDTMHKEFKPFVKNAFIGLGLLTMFKGQTKFW